MVENRRNQILTLTTPKSGISRRREIEKLQFFTNYLPWRSSTTAGTPSLLVPMSTRCERERAKGIVGIDFRSSNFGTEALDTNFLPKYEVLLGFSQFCFLFSLFISFFT